MTTALTPVATISAPRQPQAPHERPEQVDAYLAPARSAGVRHALDHLANPNYAADPVRRRARASIAMQVALRRQLVIAGLGDIHLEHTSTTRERGAL